ncbi:MAG: hypothetical protein KIS92_22430, partial [Planctomycetota bacterium]|nr:hypothetical protein [Planctomycetota bacterium]
YNFGLVQDVGKFAVDEPGSGTYEAVDAYEFPVAGADLVVRASSPVKSETDIGVHIVGTKPGGGTIHGYATIKAQVPEGQAYNVVVANDEKFASITDVIISGGVFGDGFEVLEMPDAANDVPIKYLEGLNPSEGTTVKPIFDHYEKDHDKRIRGENRLTMTAFYIKNTDGLSRIKNRDVSIRVEYRDDGQASPSEVRIFDKCRLGVSPEIPSAPDDNIRDRAEGSFGRQIIFS